MTMFDMKSIDLRPQIAEPLDFACDKMVKGQLVRGSSYDPPEDLFADEKK